MQNVEMLKKTIQEKGMVHFAIGENHFVVYNETDEGTGRTGFAIAEFRGNFCGRCCGVKQRNFYYYFPSDSQNISKFPFAFGGDKTCMIENIIGKEDTDDLDRAKTRLLRVVGDKGHEIFDNNSEHLAEFIMQGTPMSKQVEEVYCCEKPWNIFIQSIEGFPIIMAIFICLVSAGMSLLVRFPYEKVVFDLMITRTADINTTFSDCDNNFAKYIIEASQTLLAALGGNEYSFKQNSDILLHDYAKYIESELCNNARDLGKETIWKTSVYFFLNWFLLQTITILLYVRRMPSKKSFERQKHNNRYCKTLCREILAAYVPMFISCGCGCISQYLFPTEKLAYLFILVAAGIGTRFLVLLIFGCCTYSRCFTCNFKRSCCLTKFAILCLLAYIALLIVLGIYYFSSDLEDPL